MTELERWLRKVVEIGSFAARQRLLVGPRLGFPGAAVSESELANRLIDDFLCHRAIRRELSARDRNHAAEPMNDRVFSRSFRCGPPVGQ